MTPRSLVNGLASEQIALSDRGLAYGDGLFETVLVAQGEPVWWEAHRTRLRRGCQSLGIECPSDEVLDHEAQALSAGQARATLKVIITRGVSGRGYAPTGASIPTRILSLHPAPQLFASDYREGVALRWCRMTLGLQPRLAGIKHLNRLEQVLARRECRDASIAEGLMRDAEGRVVCAIAANLFIVRDGRLLTPALDRCGVAGVCRDWVLRQQPVQVCDLDPAAIESADELFLTSSLRGILPVARLEGRRWSVGPMTRKLQEALWHEVPALRPGSEAQA